MPYRIEEEHSECPVSEPWAVVKEDDGKVMGCHPNEEDAQEQIDALYADEPDLGSYRRDFHFVRLAEGTAAKPIEILREGNFVDMHGRSVVITAADVDEYVANFESRAAGQDIPIDIDHREEEAAGWLEKLWSITRAFAVADYEYDEDSGTMVQVGEHQEKLKVLMGLPKWNKLGREYVGEQIYRYLSATIDVVRKVILSVSLVNFPAIKGLQPVELARRLADGQPGSVRIGDFLQAKIHRYFTSIADDMAMTGLLSVEERKELSAAIGAALEAFAENVGPGGQRMIAVPEFDWYYYHAPPRGEKEGGQTMAKTEEELREEIREEERASLRKDMEDAQHAEAQLREKIRGEERARLAAEMAEQREVAQLAEQLCSGKAALSATPEHVTEVLGAIEDKELRGQVVDLLQSKVVDLGEHGSDREGKGGLKELPSAYKPLLRMWLKDGNDLTRFFEVNAEELGLQDGYDLEGFQE
jgi:hypothetical protein